MEYVIGYAGIPADLVDQVKKASFGIVRENTTGLFCKLDKKTYDFPHSRFFIHEMHKMVQDDHHNRLGDTGFAIICIKNRNTNDFIREFFPSTLVIPIEWSPVYGSKMERKISGNELIEKFTVATMLAKKCLTAIKKELRERANKTPLLLPTGNFKSNVLTQTLWNLQTDLAVAQDENSVIKQHLEFFELHHPEQEDDQSKLAFRLDGRNIKFRAPGKATHGFARPDKEVHKMQCLLSGRRRLGAPFQPGFHFDCTKGGSPLIGHFSNCHTTQLSKLTGKPHLNIAPNDFVRV
jgi:hypothetical protein